MHTGNVLRRTVGLVVLAAGTIAFFPARAADKRIILIAGRPSHPPGMHEFRAGCLLFQKGLASVLGVTVDVYDMGWPSKIVDGARVERCAREGRRCPDLR